MKKTAILGTKNRLTIPPEVVRALGVRAGEVTVFDIDLAGRTKTVTMCRYSTLDELAGQYRAPPDSYNLPWAEVRARARAPRHEREADADG